MNQNTTVVPILLNPPNPGALSGVSVVRLYNSQMAFCDSNGFTYVLQKAVGVADGNFVLDTADDVNRQWVILNDSLNPTPGTFVKSFNGASGIIGYQPTIDANSPAHLATFPTLGATSAGGYANGQEALVASVDGLPATYTLETAVSSTPDNRYVIATSDDPTRQWIASNINNVSPWVAVISQEIDLTAIQTVIIIPPMSRRLVPLVNPSLLITQKNGTVTTPPTMQIGSNASINDIKTSTADAAVASQAVDTNAVLAGGVAPFNYMDLTTNGIRWQITSGAVLGTATTFKGRLREAFQIGPL